MKKFGTQKLMGTIIVVSYGSAAFAQQGIGWSGCIDPMNTAPFSNPFGINAVGDSLMAAHIGSVGTVTYGGSKGPCFAPSGVSAPVTGRIGFKVGSLGSVQSTFDDNMELTFGMPYPGADWSYANIIRDGTKILFGSAGFRTIFTGASDRYIFAEDVLGSTDVQLRIDVLGDAARLSWTMTNQDAVASHTLGLWFGQWVAMLNLNGETSGYDRGLPTNGRSRKDEYIVVPGNKPPTTEHRYGSDVGTVVPDYVNFDFGQSNPYGLRVENKPSPATSDAQGLNSDASTASEFALGSDFFLLGDPAAAGTTQFPDVMFGPGNSGGDVPIASEPAYIQKFPSVSVPAGGSVQIVHYFRSTWSNANYARPYSVIVDAPLLIGADSTTASGLSQPAGGSTIRVYVDNTRGFSTVDQTIELDDVKITLTLPAGLSLASGDTAQKTIPRILPATADPPFVDFHVVADGISFGNLAYSVTVNPTPGPVKVIKGTINVAATPKLTIRNGANLVTTPFEFSDTSWDAILGLTQPTDYEAYDYDPQQNGYVISTSRARGKGTWIIAHTDYGVKALQSNPQQPADIITGARNIQLHTGWNLIANPYNYSVPLGQLVGATNANSTTSFPWKDLVAQGFVNGALSVYDPTVPGNYTYVQDLATLLLPNTGYWIYVTTPQDITLNFPPVFAEGLQGSTRAAANIWTQTTNKWHLQLSARTSKSLDANNFIGVVGTAAEVQALQIVKPPMPPTKDGVALAIEAPINGKPTRLAQALTTGNGKQEYTVTLTSREDGDVTLTWPNITSVPKNVQFRLVDSASGATRVMNQSSGYTFTAKAGTTRTFKLQVQPVTAATAVIGNVIVGRPSRDRNAPFTINYTLGGDATTTVRVLSASGQEVYSITRGRADRAGDNTVTWNLKDNANRSVAPGTYRVEIVAETTDGQRVRKIATVNLVR